MELKKRIYCVEGVHDWGAGQVEPTVEPMLALLQRMGCWEYLHRTCGTMAELEYRLRTEWSGYCDRGSVLYFCTHGGPDQIWLRSDDQAVGLLTLKEWIPDCRGCHIHFGGCDTFSGGQVNLKNLMDYTNATSVSGYARECDWLGRIAPALTLELQFFGLLAAVRIDSNTKRRPQDLREIKKAIDGRFSDCEFNMLVRRYRKT